MINLCFGRVLTNFAGSNFSRCEGKKWNQRSEISHDEFIRRLSIQAIIHLYSCQS